MKIIFVKVEHPDDKKILLSVKVELERGGGYRIISGRVKHYVSFDEWKDFDFEGEAGFSAALKKHGFDEPDVRMEIEEAVENSQETEREALV